MDMCRKLEGCAKKLWCTDHVMFPHEASWRTTITVDGHSALKRKCVQLDRNEISVQSFGRKCLRVGKPLQNVHVDLDGNKIGNPDWEELRDTLISHHGDAELSSSRCTSGNDASAIRLAVDSGSGPLRKPGTTKKRNPKGNHDPVRNDSNDEWGRNVSCHRDQTLPRELPPVNVSHPEPQDGEHNGRVNEMIFGVGGLDHQGSTNGNGSARSGGGKDPRDQGAQAGGEGCVDSPGGTGGGGDVGGNDGAGGGGNNGTVGAGGDDAAGGGAGGGGGAGEGGDDAGGGASSGSGGGAADGDGA
jgi:hypothetical protein